MGEGYNNFTRADFSKIIAETPRTKMGRDFAREFGKMAYEFSPTKSNFRSLAQRAFEKRLFLAKKYKTHFVRHMTGDGSSKIPPWKERIKGLTNRQSFSFGVRNHPRAHGIWKFFNHLSIEKSEKISINPNAFKELNIGLPKIRNPIIVWRFPCKESSSFKVYKINSKFYVLSHAKNKEVPRILKRLTFLWKKTLNKKNSEEKRIKALAEFEWVWFFANPYGRGGASVGNLLSILLRKKLTFEGVEIKHSKEFVNQDLEAFTQQKEDYISKRMKELVRHIGKVQNNA